MKIWWLTFGQPKKKAFYDLVHSKGMMIFIYTAKVMEKEKNKDTRIQSYKNTIGGGADILLSDNVIEAYEAIKAYFPSKSKKSKFFN